MSNILKVYLTFYGEIMGKVKVINSVEIEQNGGYKLAFQYCEFFYTPTESECGYRFIWINPQGRKLPSRGQARIPSIADIVYLTDLATRKGWGNHIQKKDYVRFDEQESEEE